MPTGVTVRPAKPADAETVHDVARTTWHAAYDDIVGPEGVDRTVDEWYDPADLREQIEAHDHVFLVAETSGTAGAPGTLVGFVHAGPDPDETGLYHLFRIYALPEWWGEGVGTALLDRAVGALGADADRLRLAVLAENEVGVRFYEARGFDRVETRGADLAGVSVEEHVYERPV